MNNYLGTQRAFFLSVSCSRYAAPITTLSTNCRNTSPSVWLSRAPPTHIWEVLRPKYHELCHPKDRQKLQLPEEHHGLRRPKIRRTCLRRRISRMRTKNMIALRPITWQLNLNRNWESRLGLIFWGSRKSWFICWARHEVKRWNGALYWALGKRPLFKTIPLAINRTKLEREGTVTRDL